MREITNLTLPELRKRAASSRIKYQVEDEDAWNGEDIHAEDLEHGENFGFKMSDEEKQAMDEQKVESEEQIKKEKAELVRIVVDAELHKPSKLGKVRRCIVSCRPHETLSQCLNVQRHCFVQFCPCCKKKIKVKFDEDGPIGIKFAPVHSTVKIVAIKEHYQADLVSELRMGMEVHAIDGQPMSLGTDGSDLKQRVLSLLHSASRPMTITFTPGDDNIISDSESSDDDEERDEDVGGEEAFWDYELPAGDDAMTVEDVEATSAAKDESIVPENLVEEATVELREHGAALVACKHLLDAQQTLKDAVDSPLSFKKRDASQSKAGAERTRKEKMRELDAVRLQLEEEEKRVSAQALPTTTGYPDLCISDLLLLVSSGEVLRRGCGVRV